MTRRAKHKGGPDCAMICGAKVVIARPSVLQMRNGVNDCSHHSNAQDNVVSVRDLMAPLLQEQDTEGVVRRLQMIGMDVLSSTNLQH